MSIADRLSAETWIATPQPIRNAWIDLTPPGSVTPRLSELLSFLDERFDNDADGTWGLEHWRTQGGWQVYVAGEHDYRGHGESVVDALWAACTALLQREVVKRSC